MILRSLLIVATPYHELLLNTEFPYCGIRKESVGLPLFGGFVMPHLIVGFHGIRMYIHITGNRHRHRHTSHRGIPELFCSIELFCCKSPWRNSKYGVCDANAPQSWKGSFVGIQISMFRLNVWVCVCLLSAFRFLCSDKEPYQDCSVLWGGYD